MIASSSILSTCVSHARDNIAIQTIANELKRFLKVYPNEKDIPYAHYLLGMVYYERIIDEKRSKEQNMGHELVGDVTQELKIENKVIQEIGWGKFLADCTRKWIEIETEKKITKFNILATSIKLATPCSLLYIVSNALAPNNVN